MSCYRWELDAILEGLALKNVDERENLAELAANMRYTLNAKSVSAKKLFNKRQEEKRVLNAFRQGRIKHEDASFADKVKRMNEYFRNKNRKKESE